MDAIIRHHENLPRERLIQLIWLTATAQGVYDQPPSRSKPEVPYPANQRQPIERRWYW